MSYLKQKLKHLILKLPFGVQLLQLRRKFLQHKKKKQKQRKRREHFISYHKVRLQNHYRYYTRSVKTLEVFKQYGQVPYESATAFEIGAGTYLTAPVGLSLLGFGKVITVDIRRAVPEYVQMGLKYYQNMVLTLALLNVQKLKQSLLMKI